jgi:hypothetical protein
LEELDDVPHWNDRRAGCTRLVVPHIAKCHHSNTVATGRVGMATRQKLLCYGPGMLTRTAAKARQCDFEHGRVSHGGIEPRRAFLYFADDHVRAVGRSAENGIRHPGVISKRVPSTAANDIMACTCETNCQDIEIGYSSGAIVAMRFQYRILRDGEVPVDVQVCLHQRNRRIHTNLLSARGGARVRCRTNAHR